MSLVLFDHYHGDVSYLTLGLRLIVGPVQGEVNRVLAPNRVKAGLRSGRHGHICIMHVFSRTGRDQGNYVLVLSAPLSTGLYPALFQAFKVFS